MRISSIALLLGVMLALAPAAFGGNATVHTTLTGTCTLENHNNSIGTTLWSIITCDASGACACRGTTKLVYHTESKYPATAPGGREAGRITATSSGGSVILSLAGKRASITNGSGTWTLGKVSGYSGLAFRQRGTYTVTTKELSKVSGTTTSKVRITATLACWYCTT
jgi:hypothetical protein